MLHQKHFKHEYLAKMYNVYLNMSSSELYLKDDACDEPLQICAWNEIRSTCLAISTSLIREKPLFHNNFSMVQWKSEWVYPDIRNCRFVGLHRMTRDTISRLGFYELTSDGQLKTSTAIFTFCAMYRSSVLALFMCSSASAFVTSHQAAVKYIQHHEVMLLFDAKLLGRLNDSRIT